MNKEVVIFILLFLTPICGIHSQMVIGADTLYGNEWIDSKQTYYSFQVAKNGIYEIKEAVLRSANIPVDQIEDNEWQLRYGGALLPIEIVKNKDSTFSAIRFYHANQSLLLDSFLMDDGADALLNPYYGLITDTATYYLSWSEDNGSPIFTHPERSGRRPPEATPYFWVTHRKVYHSHWVKPYFLISGTSIYRSKFMPGEGFAHPPTTFFEEEWSPENVYASADKDFVFHTRFLGDYDRHNFVISVNGKEKYRQTHSSFELIDWCDTLPQNEVSGPYTLSIEGTINDLDRFHVAYTELTYPHEPILYSDRPIYGYSDRPKPVYVFDRLHNLDWVYYDLDHHIMYPIRIDGGQGLIHAEHSVEPHQFLLFSPSFTQEIETLRPVSFSDHSSLTASDYIILSSKKLDQEALQEYAAYRSSPQGGSYDLSIVYIEDIIHSFGYGIPRHPQAIRNFAAWLEKKTTRSPILFIIGKGREYWYTRRPDQLAHPKNQSFFVPTYGYPSSDHLLFSPSGKSSPRFPMGRLSIESSQEIYEYLSKVKQQEQHTEEEINSFWRKRMIHLEGGGNLSPLVSNYMRVLRQSLSQTAWSPEVISFNRQTSVGREVAVTDQVFHAINEGATLVTFIGHSATTNLDFDINNPDKYSNMGSYPVLLALGCYSGNINSQEQSIGETYTSYKTGGFIASIATSGIGELARLYRFASDFYSILGDSIHEKRLGDIFRDALIAQEPHDPRHVEQLMLYGDPALALFDRSGPDYSFDLNTLDISPASLHTSVDSLHLQFDLVNYGLSQSDSLTLTVRHQFGDGIEMAYDYPLSPISDRSPFSCRIPLHGALSAGLNYLQMELHATYDLGESPLPLATQNNSTADYLEDPISFYVHEEGIRLEQPYDFAIVGKDSVTLGFSTTNPLQEFASYQLYLAKAGESPLYEVSVATKGGYISHRLPFQLDSGQVYEWGVSFKRQDGSMYTERATFIYIPNRSGWNQSHPIQYRRNPICEFRFPRDSLFFGTNKIYTELFHTYKGNGLGENGLSFSGTPLNSVRRAFLQIEEGIAFTVYDTIRNFFQDNTNGLYGSYNPSGQLIHAYPFRTNNRQERAKAISFLQEHIPPHAIVFAYTIADHTLQGDSLQMDEWLADTAVWSTSLVHELEEKGAKFIRQAIANKSHLYSFCFREGQGKIDERYSNDAFEYVRLGTTISRRRQEGRMSNTISLPKLEPITIDLEGQYLDGKDAWHYSLYQAIDSLEWIATSSFQFDSTISLPQTKAATVFHLHMSDSTSLRTAPHLSHLRLYYTPLPDFIWRPKKLYRPPPDTLLVGEQVSYAIAIDDIYDHKPLQPPTVQRQVLRNGVLLSDEVILAQQIEDMWYIQDSFLSTDWEAGLYELRLWLNPNEVIPEQEMANNLFFHTFTLAADRSNPIARLYLEGQPMRNGQYAARNPFFIFEITDPYSTATLAADALGWQLRYPDGTVQSFSSDSYEPKLRKRPWTQMQVSWQPQLEPGHYQIRVSATDAAGNKAPVVSRDFIITADATKSNFALLPNPAKDRIRLHYTYIDTEKLDRLRISLFSMHGKEVFSWTHPFPAPLAVGESQFTPWVNLPDLPPASYVYRIYANGSIATEGILSVLPD